MVCIVHRVNRNVVKMAMPMQPAQAAFAHLRLDREKINIIEIKRGVKFGLVVFAGEKEPRQYGLWLWFLSYPKNC